MSQPSAIARAMPARFSIPPESSAGINDSALPISTWCRSMRAVRFLAASARSVNWSSGKRTFWSTVSDPNSAPLWYITPRPRCSSAFSLALAFTILRPAMRMSPAMGSYSPMMFFIRLDLPQPEPPKTTTISPRRTSKEASSSKTSFP